MRSYRTAEAYWGVEIQAFTEFDVSGHFHASAVLSSRE